MYVSTLTSLLLDEDESDPEQANPIATRAVSIKYHRIAFTSLGQLRQMVAYRTMAPR